MSENEAQVQADLAKVFDIYRSAGVMDEGEILENIAFFALDYLCMQVGEGFVHLLEKFNESGSQNILKAKVGEIISEAFKDIEGVPYKTSSQLTPFIPSVTINNEILRQIEEIDWRLLKVFENVGDIGEWFDKDLIPRLSLTSKGGRYPTPRHLISFMAGVVNLTPDDSFADFACGTGGTLVDSHSLYPWGAGNVTGIEISPNMARLAFANLVLNQQMKHELYLGNAFDVFSKEERFIESKFDVIMMNPPFGASIDPFLIWQTFGGRITGRSETLFASLAYEKLKPGGRMAVLVPSGVLFSTGSGETILRETLVEDGALRAVISLPQDSMQPVNNLSTHVLYAVKPGKNTAKSNGVWFCRVEHDGFSNDKRRTPTNENDLILIESVFQANPVFTNPAQVIVLPAETTLTWVNGYRVEANSLEVDFQVRLLSSDMLVRVTQNNVFVEWIYSDSVNVFRGSKIANKNSVFKKSRPNSFDTSVVSLFDVSKMNADWEQLSEEEMLTDYSLQIKSGKGEIRKRSSSKSAVFGKPTKNEKQAFGILIKGQGEVVSGFIPFTVDPLSKSANPQLFTVMDGKAYNTLLLFYGDVIVYQLQQGEGIIYLIAEIDSDVVAFYDPRQNTISSSIEFEFGIHFDQIAFKSDVEHRGVILNKENKTLGILVDNNAIVKSNYELQSERYWVEKQQVVTTRSAAQILADIKKNQNQLTSTLDRLLSISEIQPIAGTELPPQLYMIEPPAGLLQGIQQSIWEIVQKQSEQAGDYLTPLPFQADDIQAELKENISVMDVQRTLELFERMGLIVGVSYESVPYYRLSEERDLVKGDAA